MKRLEDIIRMCRLNVTLKAKKTFGKKNMSESSFLYLIRIGTSIASNINKITVGKKTCL